LSLSRKSSSFGATLSVGNRSKSEGLPGGKVIIAMLFALTPAFSQITTLNLGTQGRNADFSNLSFTRPVTVGTSLPATCQVGQLFFNSVAAAGSNLYGCTATNTWTLQSGGGSTGPSTGTGGGTTTGTGTALFTPSSVSFSAQTVGTTTPSQAIVFSNSGTGSIAISAITLSGANSLDFWTSNNCGSSLGVGASCTIAVSLTPSVVGAETATLTIADNTSNSPQTVSLSGTGTAVASTSGATITPASPSTTAGTPLTLTASKAVTWSLAAGSLGSIAANGTSVVYTPPSSIPVQNARGGCMITPNDSVYNTRIDSLPVHASSATWMGSFINTISFLPSWGLNVLDNTVPQTPMFFYYTTSENGNFQIAAWPNRKREGGAFPTDGNNDHHMVSVNHQTCQFYETYQEGNPNASCASCNANSGWKYPSTSYVQPTGGTTDAAGLPLEPLTVHLSEVKAGAINHAMRFTLCTGCIYSGSHLWPATASNGSNTPAAPPLGARFRLKSTLVPSGVFAVNLTSGGSGYTVSPNVTFTGCQTTPSVTAMITGGSVSSVVINNPGAGCVNPTATFGGPGSGAAATVQVFSPTAQVFLTALQKYGMILADIGTSGEIETDSNLNADAGVVSAMGELFSARLGASYFEVVDESSLMLSASSSQVNANNGYVTPAAHASIIATDGSGNQTTVPIVLQPVIVAVPYTTMTVQAGMTGYQLSSWVNGTSNQTVTWTRASGVGSVTSAGVYTPPASVTSQSSAVLTATSAADPNATANVYINVIPTGANPTNAIRIDVGNLQSSYTDVNGNIWMPDTIGFETGAYAQTNENYPDGLWGSITDPALYQTFNYTYGDDITYGPFIVPNGNYKIGFVFGRGSCSGTYVESTVYGNGLIWGPMWLESQGQIGAHFDLGKATNFECRDPYTEFIPAKVTNNVMYATIRTVGGSGSHTSPLLNALEILPDTTAPYLTIDTQEVTTVTAGSVIQLYAVGWYMGNSVTWSVSGGGTIDQTGLYTAPSTAPSSNQTVTVTATSTLNTSVTATTTLTFTP
jgi:hypothetical protein